MRTLPGMQALPALGPQDDERARRRTRSRPAPARTARALIALAEEEAQRGRRHERDDEVDARSGARPDRPARPAIDVPEPRAVLPDDGEHRARLDRDLEDLRALAGVSRAAIRRRSGGRSTRPAGIRSGLRRCRAQRDGERGRIHEGRERAGAGNRERGLSHANAGRASAVRQDALPPRVRDARAAYGAGMIAVNCPVRTQP